MKSRLLAIVLMGFCYISPSYAIYFAGDLTTTDSVAVDAGWGDFYYDMYYVAVETPMLVEIFMTPVDPILPWLGYWDGDFSATPDYDTPPPEAYRIPDPIDAIGDQLYLSFNAVPGIEYQIMAATYDYNPTDLGAYNFFITVPDRRDIGLVAETLPGLVLRQVPAPASWMLLALGLIGLVVVNSGRNRMQNFILIRRGLAGV